MEANEKIVLDAQRQHWERTLGQKPEMFGRAPSEAAYKAAEIFAREDSRKILELGAGQGRDTVLLAERGFAVVALDYSESGLRSIRQKSQVLSHSQSVHVLRHDVRDALPLRDESFDACYSHMLYCMALKLKELESLSAEIWRVLRPGGINIYTVRNTEDSDYGKGIHRGEDLYEVGGFVVQFFSREKILRLASGWEILAIDPFAEGTLPRKLFCVTLKKPMSKRLK
ncbi:MAG TPA: class I SAM-dependent methyltransferase [Candidatus Binatia bacterium]|nr:class I SAM-dependent methyltransferase [Candidatus Binatia bacterium]